MNRVLPSVLLLLLAIAATVGYMNETDVHGKTQPDTAIATQPPDECKPIDEIGQDTVGANGYVVIRDGRAVGFVNASEIGQTCDPFR